MKGNKSSKRLAEIKAEIDAIDAKILKILKSRAVDGFEVGQIKVGGNTRTHRMQGFAIPAIIHSRPIRKVKP